MRRRLFAVAVLAALLVLPAAAASAHPLGNFTTNTYAGLAVTPDAVRIDYVLDLAEIPALQARQRIDADSDGEVGEAEGRRYREDEC
ncbi:MAG: nickel transporter, partial [Euzebyaceae bacterium]|nr:nickel transporter [Euzebyaceae bacterium]